MIDLYFWPTPNGHKITIMLEECGLEYRIVPVNIGRGEQFTPEFLAISPNNRMPAIVDHEPLGGGAPLSIFESGAILTYLADKTGKFLPSDPRKKYDVLQWLAWQVGGLGPMLGQANHFGHYAPEKIPYAIQRYYKEANRLFGVMERSLKERSYLAGEYSIADIASYPWARGYERYELQLAEFPRVSAWLDAVKARPAVVRGLAAGAELSSGPIDEAAKKVLFGQTATSTQAKA